MPSRKVPFRVLPGPGISVDYVKQNVVVVSSIGYIENISSVIREITFSIDSSPDLTFDLVHNLNTYFVSISNYDSVTKEDLYIECKKIDKNTVRLFFNAPPQNIISIIRGINNDQSVGILSIADVIEQARSAIEEEEDDDDDANESETEEMEAEKVNIQPELSEKMKKYQERMNPEPKPSAFPASSYERMKKYQERMDALNKNKKKPN